MFKECSSLIELPDISKLDTNNVTDMSLMFSQYSSLSSLPVKPFRIYNSILIIF